MKQTFVPNDCLGFKEKNQSLNVLLSALLGYYINNAKLGLNLEAE